MARRHAAPAPLGRTAPRARRRAAFVQLAARVEAAPAHAHAAQATLPLALVRLLPAASVLPVPTALAAPRRAPRALLARTMRKLGSRRAKPATPDRTAPSPAQRRPPRARTAPLAPTSRPQAQHPAPTALREPTVRPSELPCPQLACLVRPATTRARPGKRRVWRAGQTRTALEAQRLAPLASLAVRPRPGRQRATAQQATTALPA